MPRKQQNLEDLLVNLIDDQSLEESRGTQRMVNALVNRKARKAAGTVVLAPRTRTRSKTAEASPVSITAAA